MKKELWLRLRGYRFEHLVPAHLADRLAAAFGGSDVSTRAFAAKVARKHGWTTSFAVRAIAEYKKFVYLGVTSNFPVTPPRVIDAVWHEHILFSAAYRDFCHEVLGRPFDHNPELVPDDEQTAAFQAQYAATLALYRAEFDAAPPADLWGTPKFDRGRAPAPARRAIAHSGSTGDDDMPLHTYFDASGSAGELGGTDSFGGGGGFSGGGGGDSWSSDGPADSGSDGGSSDGGGDGSGGCSSGCGGGE